MDELPPAPAVSTINLIREVAGYVVSKQPVSTNTKAVLDNALAGHKNKIQMMLAVIASHKMQRLSSILSAADLCQEQLTDPEYIHSIRNSPSELRLHFRLLKEIEQADLDFLRSQTAETAEREGFSRDPTRQYNFFFGSEAGTQAVLPPDMTVDERRKTRSMLDELLGLMSGKESPKPPDKLERIIDAKFEIPKPQEPPVP